MKMQPKLAILTAAVMALHYCTAAPSAYNNNGDTLLRPSPINPDIPMEPKPAETITFITDPKEIAKFKREINVEAAKHDITAPTTMPPKNVHPLYQPEQAADHNERLPQQHRQKRDTKIDTSSTKAPLSIGTLNDKQTSKQISTTVKPKRTRDRTASTKSTAQATTKSTTTTTAASSLPVQVKHRQKRDDKNNVVPLIYRDQHKQPSPSHIQHQDTELSHIGEHVSHVSTTIKPQTLPLIIEQTSVKEKRDIPVPLVPKYHHPEESPKAEDKQETTSPKTDANKPTEHTTSTTTTTTSTKQISESLMEKKQEKRMVNENSDVVQVEDLTEQHQQQHSTKQQHQEANSFSTTPSTTGPSVFRHRPVPVAELFAKGKSTETPENDHHEVN